MLLSDVSIKECLEKGSIKIYPEFDWIIFADGLSREKLKSVHTNWSASLNNLAMVFRVVI
jgi:hypothetical protein